MIFWNLAFILILIALNAFFVGVEFAVVASRRARLDLLSSAESSAGRIVRRWLENNEARDRLIAASQLGITVVSLALGAVGENTFEAILEPYFHEITLPPWLEFINRILPALPLVISLAIITSFHVVLGEQVPKVAVLRAPERFALASAPVMAFFSKILQGIHQLVGLVHAADPQNGWSAGANQPFEHVFRRRIERNDGRTRDRRGDRANRARNAFGGH